VITKKDCIPRPTELKPLQQANQQDRRPATSRPPAIMFSTASIAQSVVVVMVVICLCPLTESKDISLNRAKRGFRLNSASRVAHGYGKRGYASPSGDVAYPELERDALDRLQPLEDEKDLELSIMSVDELASLTQSHPKLARALVKKFIDVNGDNLVTAEELFRAPMRK